MNRFLKIMTFCLILLVFIVPSVYAGTAEVDKISVDATVNTNGDMYIKETIKWRIEDDLNGVYRDVVINGDNELNSATDIQVLGVTVNEKQYSYSSETLANGSEGKYNVNKDSNGVQIKIFSPSYNESKTTEITYVLKNVAVKYNDVSEVYWNFIGDGWDYGIDDVDITIHIPEGSSMLKIFGHGPLEGISEIVNGSTIKLTVSKLRPNEQVDARVLMDSNLIEPAKVVEQDALNEILEKEKDLALEANNKRQRAKNSLFVSIILCILSVTIPVILYINFKRKLPKIKFDGKYYRELPEDYGPCVMSRLIYNGSGPWDMLATLLDLVRKKYVKIETIYRNGDKTKKPKDYNLILINKDLGQLSSVEKHYIQKLIFKDTDEISIKELNKKNNKSYEIQKKAHEEFKKWNEIIEDKSKLDGVIKQKSKGAIMINIICCLCYLMTFGAIALGTAYNYTDIIALGVITSIISFIELTLVVSFVENLSVKTEKGLEHEKMWKAFKKFLLDFSKLNEKGYESLVLWEHYLVYATSLGIASQVIKQLKILYPTEFNDEKMMEQYTMFSVISSNSYDNAFSSFQETFVSASSSAFSSASSSDGSGGGFSGGSGGGGGGGGGGGF